MKFLVSKTRAVAKVLGFHKNIQILIFFKNSSNLESSSPRIRIALDTVENSGAFCGSLSWFRKIRTLERLEVLVKND